MTTRRIAGLCGIACAVVAALGVVFWKASDDTMSDPEDGSPVTLQEWQLRTDELRQRQGLRPMFAEVVPTNSHSLPVSRSGR